MFKKVKGKLLLSLSIACLSQLSYADLAHKGFTHAVFPDEKKQTVLGIGVEIQSDSIGSGNHQLPEEPIAVPHDLTKKERKRFAKEMLSGFRYLRLAGGLYWRGLDDQQKYLQPRWPAQLEELKTLIDTAGIEGVSFEYWSPAPFWKANGKYVSDIDKNPRNTLRPFVPEFTEDPVYRGDRTAFFDDFSDAMLKDIQTLEAAGIKVSIFGMQNEPDTNNDNWSTNAYHTPQDYMEAFVPVAKKVRAHDPNIMIIADAALERPTIPFLERVREGMEDEDTRKLIDTYVVHTIGWDSNTVEDVHKYIRTNLPPKPWFQNEYEYLTGGATPERALNTVQHIMNSFQLADNTSWFWLHALKPSGNAEASGYALGFWNSMIAPSEKRDDFPLARWRYGPEFTSMSDELKGLEFIHARRKTADKPGEAYDFILDRPATVYKLVQNVGSIELEGWKKTDLSVSWEGGSDTIYQKDFEAGEVFFNAHDGQKDGQYGAPHAAFIKPISGTEIKVDIGSNEPIYVHSQQLELFDIVKDVKPGHWVYNPFNWNAVGSFAKRMPWDSVVLNVMDSEEDEDARILAFEKPNGKRTIVVSNRHSGEKSFQINTNLEGTKWVGYRYTPYSRGKNTRGVKVGKLSGKVLNLELPSLSWEFWEEQ